MKETQLSIETIEDITNVIVTADNFLNDLQDDDVFVDQEKICSIRRDLEAVLKFYNAEG